MTKYAELKAKKDELVKAATMETDHNKLYSLIKKVDKVQKKIDNMTIAEAMREVK